MLHIDLGPPGRSGFEGARLDRSSGNQPETAANLGRRCDLHNEWTLQDSNPFDCLGAIRRSDNVIAGAARLGRYRGRMGPRRALVESHRNEIRELLSRHRGKAIAIFGSAARADDTSASDIDFLVEFEPGSSLFDLMHLEDDLEELLGCPVDVLSAGGLKSRDHHILRDALPL